ncbi:MAG: hypothetical protein HYY13_12150 [Nitrospirae bacterium]|nr:hypothetical protein [Nitrospirota bacterium]
MRIGPYDCYGGPPDVDGDAIYHFTRLDLRTDPCMAAGVVSDRSRWDGATDRDGRPIVKSAGVALLGNVPKDANASPNANVPKRRKEPDMTPRFSILGSRFSILALLLTLYTLPFTILPSCGGGDEGGGGSSEATGRLWQAFLRMNQKECEVCFECNPTARCTQIFGSVTRCKELVAQTLGRVSEEAESSECGAEYRRAGQDAIESYEACVDELLSRPNDSLCSLAAEDGDPFYFPGVPGKEALTDRIPACREAFDIIAPGVDATTGPFSTCGGEVAVDLFTAPRRMEWADARVRMQVE